MLASATKPRLALIYVEFRIYTKSQTNRAAEPRYAFSRAYTQGSMYPSVPVGVIMHLCAVCSRFKNVTRL